MNIHPFGPRPRGDSRKAPARDAINHQPVGAARLAGPTHKEKLA
jgi:hypothetical protein